MDRDELAEDVSVAHDQLGGLAAKLEILRDQANRHERKDLVSVAELRWSLHDRRRADPTVAAKPNMWADDRVRADHRPVADDRVRVHHSAGIDRHPGSEATAFLCDHAKKQVGFRGDVLADEGPPVRASEARAARAHRDLQPQAITRHHRKAELGVIDAPEEGSRGGALIAGLRQQNRCDLRERFNHQDAGHQRSAGEMPLKKLLADGDVLVGDHSTPGLVFGDRVNERGRIAIAETIQRFGNID